MSRKIAAHYMLSGGEVVKNPIVEVAEDGTILSVATNVENIDSVAGVEFYSGILIPGMVNSHNHLEYSYVKGKIARGGGLPKFISTIINIKITDTTSLEDRAAAASVVDAFMYSEGVVAVGDHNNNDYVYEVKKDSKIYYHSLVELFDVDGQSADEAFADGVERMNVHKGYGLQATVIPHATYTMDDRLLALCGGSVASDKGVVADGVLSVHFKESIAMAGEEEADRIFAALSPNRSSVMFVHSIYASSQDIDRAVEQFGDKLTVVTCPLSNLYIENNITSIEMLREKGVRIAIGTDSLSSNEVICMVDEMRTLQERFPQLSLAEIVKWATQNGAEALKIDDWAGKIEVGKKPGIVNISALNLDNMSLTPESKGCRIC